MQAERANSQVNLLGNKKPLKKSVEIPAPLGQENTMRMDFEDDTQDQRIALMNQDTEIQVIGAAKRAQIDDQPFEGEDEEEDDDPPDRSNLEVRRMMQSTTFGGKQIKQPVFNDNGQEAGSSKSLGQVGGQPSTVEPGVNPATPSLVPDLPADVNQQLLKETAAQKRVREEDYQKMLNTRDVGFKYEDDPDDEEIIGPAQVQPRVRDRPVLSAKPINDALRFPTPTKQASLQHALNEFYDRNTTLQIIDSQELPMDGLFPEGRLVTKEIKNVHINSDHQRVYIWELIYPAVSEESFETLQLWMRVYSLADGWTSQNSHSQSLFQKIHRLEQCQLEVNRLVDEKKKYQTVVQPEDASKSGVHKIDFIQRLVDKERQRAAERKTLEKAKKAELKQLQAEVSEMLSSPDYRNQQKENIIIQKRQGEGQTPLKSDFSIFIGEFIEQEYEYMHNKIISFYKQFVQSRDSLYFYKFENPDTDFDKKIKQQFPTQKSFIGNKSIDSGADGVLHPYLYELSAYSSSARRVLVNGKPVRLQSDQNMNQFAIIRSLDPRQSGQFSQISDLFVAIMKEIKIVQHGDPADSRVKTKRGSLKQLESLYLETSIEIFRINEKQPLLGAVCDNRKVDSQFSPKNISAHHRPEQSTIDKKKPVNCDFNFCGWYFVDEINHNINFAFMIDKLQVNMRTPFNLDPQVVPLEEMQSHIMFSKNVTNDEEFLDEEAKFLAGFEITQGMPVYRIDLKNPTNFARLESYRNASSAAKQTWRREMSTRDYQTLCENAEGISQNLDYSARCIYIVVQQVNEEIIFESLYPIIPSFFWQTQEGQVLRNEILQVLDIKHRPQLDAVSSENSGNKQTLTYIKNKLNQTIDFDNVYEDSSPISSDKSRFQAYENSFDKLTQQRILRIVSQHAKSFNIRLAQKKLQPIFRGGNSSLRMGSEIMFRLSADQRNFIHLNKTMKKRKYKASEQVVKSINKSENIQPLDEMYDGEEITYYEYEIYIGFLQLKANSHCMLTFEERVPERRMEHFLSHVCHLKNEEFPLSNPFDPQMKLLILEGQEDLFERQINTVSDQFYFPEDPKRIHPNRVLILKPKQNGKEWQGPNHPDHSKLLNDPQYRDDYISSKLNEYCLVRSVAWSKRDPRSSSLGDFINEFSKIKVWAQDSNKIHEIGHELYKINTINFFPAIFKLNPQILPTNKCIQDMMNQPDEPQGWKILKTLLFTHMNFVTIKQQQHTTNNVIIALKPKITIDRQRGLASCLNQTLHFVAQLDENYEQFKHFNVIRRNLSLLEEEKYGIDKTKIKRKRKNESYLETTKYLNFINDFIDENKTFQPSDSMFCRSFPMLYKEASMIAFDISSSPSFGSQCEIFAFKCPAPHNCIKFCEYDYALNEIREIYDINLEPDKINKIFDIQLARSSSDELSYAVFLEFGKMKEIYFVSFSKKDPKLSLSRNHHVYKVNGSLQGKINILTPQFQNSFNVTQKFLKFKINHKFRMLSQTKYIEDKDFIDGVSLFFDEARIDIDYRYYLNGSDDVRIRNVYSNLTNLFEYEFSKCRVIKANCKQGSSLPDYDFTLISLKFRDDFIKQTEFKPQFSEQQKLKLINYFIETIEHQSYPDYGSLKCLINSLDELEVLSSLLQPRYELFGANFFTFILKESSEIEKKVFQSLTEFDQQNNEFRINQILALNKRKTISGSYIGKKPRFSELDMSMLSLISWSLHYNYNNRVKNLIKVLKFMATRCLNREEAADYQVIFYASVFKLIRLGIIDLKDFFIKDESGYNNCSELYSRSLDYHFLPQFAPHEDQMNIEYTKCLQKLELYTQYLFGAQKKDVDLQKDNMYEVQYAFIDMEWPNLLNIFNQKPSISILQDYQTIVQYSGKKAITDFKKIYSTVLKDYQQKQYPLIMSILSQNRQEIYTYDNIQASIHFQYSYALWFFLSQLLVYTITFLMPFSIELFYIDEILQVPAQNNQLNIPQVHQICGILGIVVQVIICFVSWKQIVRPQRGSNYLFQFWINFTTLIVYFSTQARIWYLSDKKVENQQIYGLRVVYYIDCLLIFMQASEMIIVFPSINFMSVAIKKMLIEISPFFVICFVYVLLFSCLFRTLRIEEVDLDESKKNYEYVGLGPFRWLIYVARVVFLDNAVTENRGFLPDEVKDPYNLSNAQSAIVRISWITWVFNVMLFVFIFFNFVIPIMQKSYEDTMKYKESQIFKIKAELIERTVNLATNFGIISSPFEIQPSLIIRKKKYLHELEEHEGNQYWQSQKMEIEDQIKKGLDHSNLKLFASLRNLENRVGAVETSNNTAQREVMQQLLKVQSCVDQMQEQISMLKVATPLKQPQANVPQTNEINPGPRGGMNNENTQNNNKNSLQVQSVSI